MAKCSVCGTELEEGQKFCFECGAAVPQTKKCIKCGAEIALKMKFCPECGANQNGETNAVTSGFSMGDKNVIAGDVIGHKEETHVAGNATFIKNEDQTKLVKRCHICGSLIQIIDGFDCPECGQFSCSNCYDEIEGCCTECAQKHGEQKINRYKEALKMVLADGRIDFSERKELISLQQELGISAEQARTLEEELKKSALGTSSEITTFEKMSIDKATELFYKEGNIKEALQLLEPVYQAHKHEEKVLDIYLPVLAEVAPLEALDIIDGLEIDILTAFVTFVLINLKQKKYVEAEKKLLQALRIWHDSSLVKCYQVLYNYAMYKQFNEFSFMEKACNLAEQLGEAQNELELSYQVRIQVMLREEVGDAVTDFDKDFCEQNHLYWFIMSNNPLLTREENAAEKERRKKEKEARIKAEAEAKRLEEEQKRRELFAKKEAEAKAEKKRIEFEKAEKEKKRLLSLQDEILNESKECTLDDLLKLENEFHDSQIQFLLCRYYEKKKDWDNSFAWAKKSAEQNNADGIARLASHFLEGNGCEKNEQRAFELAKKSSDMNSSWGQNCLGVCYRVQQNYEEAVKWFRLSAEQGNERGQFNLGFMYEKGKGVAQNYEEAVKWYRLSAEQGYERGQCNLGEMYEYGKDVAQNYEEALKWYKKAADQGNAWSQYKIGKFYYHGYGVEKNCHEAEKWFQLAANKGNQDAINILNNKKFQKALKKEK